MLTKIRHTFALVVLLTSLVMLTWGNFPNRRQSISRLIGPDAMHVPSAGSEKQPALLEVRQVSLVWPGLMRIGDETTITVVFERTNSEILAPKSDILLVDIYQRYNLMVEGRLEAAGVRLDPANPRRESLPPGQTVTISWQVTAQDTASHPAKVWLLLRYLPLQGGPAGEVPVYVHDLDLRAMSLFGLGGPQARLWGSVGIILALALNYDVMIGWIKRMATKNTKDTRG